MTYTVYTAGHEYKYDGPNRRVIIDGQGFMENVCEVSDVVIGKPWFIRWEDGKFLKQTPEVTGVEYSLFEEKQETTCGICGCPNGKHYDSCLFGAVGGTNDGHF